LRQFQPLIQTFLNHAELQGASFAGAQMQGASLNRTQLQGAFLNYARLDGASLFGAKLQGVSAFRLGLRGAELYQAVLDGAFLAQAELQGAWLRGVMLRGAELDAAYMDGASLVDAQLQGASLKGVELHGMSLQGAFVWRINPQSLQGALINPEALQGALIDGPQPQAKYLGLDCPSDFSTAEPCDWTEGSYAALKKSIEEVPAGQERDAALKRIEPLRKKPYKEDAASVKLWHELAAKSRRSAETYPEELAKRLIGIGCDAFFGPDVIGALILQLYNGRFGNNLAQPAEVARAFLNGRACPGAEDLSERDKADLRGLLASQGL
jgi:hypothetical protein